jgi:hypothetical protein
MNDQNKSVPAGNVDQHAGEKETTALVTSDSPQETGMATVEDMFTGRSIQVYTSIQGEDTATKIKVYNAMNDQEAAISDMLGKTLVITDVLAFPVEMTDDETGELINLLRVVLIDKDGKSYGSVARGVASSIQKIIGVVGQAPWNPAIKISPVEKKTRKGFKTLVLRLEA